MANNDNKQGDAVQTKGSAAVELPSLLQQLLGLGDGLIMVLTTKAII